MVRYGTVRHGMVSVRYGKVWYGMGGRHGTVSKRHHGRRKRRGDRSNGGLGKSSDRQRRDPEAKEGKYTFDLPSDPIPFRHPPSTCSKKYESPRLRRANLQISENISRSNQSTDVSCSMSIATHRGMSQKKRTVEKSNNARRHIGDSRQGLIEMFRFTICRQQELESKLLTSYLVTEKPWMEYSLRGTS